MFVENYDIHTARQMVSGCDVWLNNPTRRSKRSGTSGQKSAATAGLNLSILDGWWREGYDYSTGSPLTADDSHSPMTWPSRTVGMGPTSTKPSPAK